MHKNAVNISNKEIYKVTWIGFFVNIILTVLKIAAGIFGKSTAMIADAVHSLSDLVSDIIVLVFVRIATRPIDENHRYGHGKFETFSTFIIGVILIFVGFGILWNAGKNVYGFINGVIPEAPESIALFAACISIISKETLFWYTIFAARKHKSQILKANAWHHRSDALSSVATFFGIGGAIFLGGQWQILDPVAAAIVSLMIIKVAWDIIIPAVNDLLEKSLPENLRIEIFSIISSVEHVQNPHGIRTRKIGNNYAIECHLKIDKYMTVEASHDVTIVVENKLKEKYGLNTHVVIHVDPA